jgi:hypothetical protein
MVDMMVVVDFALFGSREIGPGREPFIDRQGGRHRPSNDCGTEQCRAKYRGCFDEHHRPPYAVRIILCESEFVRFFVPSAICPFPSRPFDMVNL